MGHRKVVRQIVTFTELRPSGETVSAQVIQVITLIQVIKANKGMLRRWHAGCIEHSEPVFQAEM